MKQNDGLFVLAVTGGIASGKSTVTAYLQQCGLPVVDADAIARALTRPYAPGTMAIARYFGSCFVQNGTLDRRALAQLVFSDEKARRKLNGVIHPMVIAQIQRQLTALARNGYTCAILDVPLLFESGLDAMADEIWCVDAPASVRIPRIMQRDGVSREDALRRIAAQMDDATRREKSDVVIDNASGWDNTRRQVDELLRERRLVD